MNNAIAREDTFTELYDAEVRHLATRVRILEAALACIGQEAEEPLDHPELAFMAVQRIASVTRQALVVLPPPGSDDDGSPISQLRPIASARARSRGRR